MTRSRRLALLALASFALATSAVAAVAMHDLTGRWIFTVVTENGTGTPVVVLKQEGEKLTGTYESNALGSRSLEGSVKGDSMRFVLSGPPGNESVILTYMAAIVTADSLNGAVDFAGMGGASFTAVREK
jgi:hypothetical protein